MSLFAKKSILAVAALVVMVGVVPAIASAVVIGPDNTAIDGTLNTSTLAVFTVSGAITITCDTHTVRATTGRATDRVTLAAASNSYTDTSTGRNTCPTDQRGVTAVVVVSSAWQLTATRTTGGTIDVPDNAARITLNGGIFGGCNSQIQRSSVAVTYTSPRLQTDPRNTVNTRGSGGFCVFGTAATQQETIVLVPPVTIR